jgi:hypothetical protein
MGGDEANEAKSFRGPVADDGAEAYGYHKPWYGYNKTLAGYSEWLLGSEWLADSVIDLHGPLSAVVGAWRERVGHRKPGVERDVMTVEEVGARGGVPRRADEACGGGDKGDAAVRA